MTISAVTQTKEVVGQNNGAQAEASLRRREDQLIKQFEQQIEETRQNTKLDEETKKQRIEGFEQQIQDILNARKQREAEALQQQQEKMKREQPKEQEETENSGMSQTEVRSLIDISVSNETITELNRNKRSMQGEAARLDNEMAIDGLGKERSFKSEHLQKLQAGIQGVAYEINKQIGNMNDEVEKLREENKTQTNESQTDDNRNEQEEDRVDIKV